MGLKEMTARVLEARGLDIELLVRLGVVDSPRAGFDIRIPYMENGLEVNAKYRTISGEKKFMQETGAKKVFWNVDVISDATLESEPLIITEGEMDAFAALQAGFSRVVSVPDGAPAHEIGDKETTKYEFLTNAPAALGRITEIIICADSDQAGANLLADLGLRLGRARCKWVRYPLDCKDLNDALLVHGVRGVTEAIRRAQWLRVDGIFKMSELPPLPSSVPYDVGIPGLEKHFKARLGDLVVVTGIPSSGKSSFVGDVVCRLVKNYHWPAAFAAFEQRPQTDHRRMLRMWFNRTWENEQQDEILETADRWIEENFTFIVANEDDEVTLEWFLERASTAVVRYGVKVMVLDPWNELDHARRSGESQTEYVGAAIKLLKKFATKHRVLMIVVAHPAKMMRGKDGLYPIPTLYDISDSAHWYNKPDVGIIVHVEKDGVGKMTGESLVRVAKVRYHDQIGEPGDLKLKFIRKTASYEPIEQPYDARDDL